MCIVDINCYIEILKKMMNLNKYWCGMIVLAILIVGGLTACEGGSDKPKVVVCVPVYGQSLAMGEESELVTDIEGLKKIKEKDGSNSKFSSRPYRP